LTGGRRRRFVLTLRGASHFAESSLPKLGSSGGAAFASAYAYPISRTAPELRCVANARFGASPV
jgi:hypothetical protein